MRLVQHREDDRAPVVLAAEPRRVDLALHLDLKDKEAKEQDVELRRQEAPDRLVGLARVARRRPAARRPKVPVAFLDVLQLPPQPRGLRQDDAVPLLEELERPRLPQLRRDDAPLEPRQLDDRLVLPQRRDVHRVHRQPAVDDPLPVALPQRAQDVDVNLELEDLVQLVARKKRRQLDKLLRPQHQQRRPRALDRNKPLAPPHELVPPLDRVAVRRLQRNFHLFDARVPL